MTVIKEELKIYNQDGNVASELKTPEFLLADWNPTLVHQVYKSLLANQRRPWGHTKDRSEVSGGGKKPWRQKGTGRARHGSIRSPLWRHGGVTFGPRNQKSYYQKINRAMARQALISSLAYVFQDGRLKVVNNLSLPVAKTKELGRVLKNLSAGRTTLLVVSNGDQLTRRLASNLNKVDAISAKDINVYDILSHFYTVFDQQSLDSLKERLKYGQ